MDLNIYTDAPSKTDIFEGKAHENLAKKIAYLAQDDTTTIIGLDGYLGSGKSTVIDMAIEKITSENIHIIKFDSELYHFGATKKALIDILYEGFKNTPNVNAKLLLEYKDYALGNIFNYTKNVSSNISLWTVAFISSTVISLQTLRFFITHFSGLFTSRPLAWSTYIQASLEFALVILPIIIGFLYLNKKGVIDEKGSDKIKKPSLGDILKRNGEDTITEKIIVNKEIGTLELKAALMGFVSCTPEATRLILIIDNLDRISNAKIKEIWSDIELITEVAGDRLKIIIPYSGKHVAKALSEDDNEGMEFIAKRIPINFFVPPLISAGWRDGFLKLWNETFKNSDDNVCYEVCELIERWLPKNYNTVTPRLIKRIINDINVTSLTFPSFSNDKILVAFYVLMVRYSLIDFNKLIQDYTDKKSDNSEPVDVVRMQVTHRQFNRLFENEEAWRKGLICIHFQTNSEFAISELIEEPLIEAITYQDTESYMKISSMYGFPKIWMRILHDTSADVLILFLHSMCEVNKEVAKLIRDEIFDKSKLKQMLSGEYNKKVVHSLVDIHEKIGVNPKKLFLNDRIEYLKSKIQKKNHLINLSDNESNAIFEEIDCLLKITNLQFTSLFKAVSGDIFFKNLLGKDNVFKNIDIGNIYLSDTELAKGISYALVNQQTFNLFNPQLINSMMMAAAPFSELVEGKKTPMLDELYLAFNSGKELMIHDFRLLCLDKRWSNSNLTKLFPLQKSIIDNHPEEYHAALIFHKICISDNSPIASLSSIKNDEKLNEALFNYLLFSKSFNKVIGGLDNDNVISFLKKPLTMIIEREKVRRLESFKFIRDIYPKLKKLMSADLILKFFNPWDSFSGKAIPENDNESISIEFINDLKGVDFLPKYKEKFFSIIFEHLTDNARAYEIISKSHPVYLAMMDLISVSPKKIKASNLSRVFSDYYCQEEIKVLKGENNIKSIISVIHPDDTDEIMKSLMDIIERNDIDTVRQIYLIRDFGDMLSYDRPAKSDKRSVAKLFTYSADYDYLSKWLDNQGFAIGSWKVSDKKTIENFVLSNKELFPNLSKTRYFKKRAHSPDKK